MRDRSSFRLCSRQGDEMSASIAAEMRSIALSAAEPVRPGETIKGQLRRATTRLQATAWRVRAAWYGEAGCWSGSAVEDFRRRAARLNRQTTEAARADQMEADRLEVLADRLERSDPEMGRELARPLRHAARAYRTGAAKVGGR